MTCALTYHDVAPRAERDEYGFPGPVAGHYKLEPSDFERHLDALGETGLPVGLIGTGAAVALTFDDGGASALSAAAMLERRGWRGHFFITTGRIGTKGFLDPEGVRELVARGHDVGSHSHSHPGYMGSLARGEITREWRQSFDALGEITGAAPQKAAVPGGFVSPPVIEEAAGTGYQLLLTSTPTCRSAQHHGLLVHGRYTVWAGTSAPRVAAYARGGVWARATTWLSWQAKSVPKRVSPTGYETLRRSLLSRS